MAADCTSWIALALRFSSIKVSAMKLLTTDGLTGAYVLDHRTTPEVVMISNVSNMAASGVRRGPGEGGWVVTVEERRWVGGATRRRLLQAGQVAAARLTEF